MEVKHALCFSNSNHLESPLWMRVARINGKMLIPATLQMSFGRDRYSWKWELIRMNLLSKCKSVSNLKK